MSSQDTAAPDASSSHNGKGEQNYGRLGFFLCWAVVFADIGTSVYYVPGILYGQVGKLAGFFVFLTMAVFVLLTLKYSEVTYRYPQGGGVVTVSANAMKPWVGALGGMFILVDYFLTAAISSLSGLIYFSVVAPHVGPMVLPITLIVLALLGLLNWWGISESAIVSAVGAVIAFISDIAILIEIFTHESIQTILNTIPLMFSGKPLTGLTLLTGFAGAFLAFSGLESISQLSPVMKIPRKRTGRLALLLVVLTIGITSPLLTLFSTTLLQNAANVDPNQFISLLGGKYSQVLGIEVAISASALLIFASNTAIIGTYHVFLALSRMRFFPNFVEHRSAWRGTPHYSIALATGIPILILIVVRGDIIILGDMYAFGLLGAFSLTCLGLDIVRSRERRRHKERERLKKLAQAGNLSNITGLHPILPQTQNPIVAPVSTPIFVLGIVTTAIVILAWSTNLIFKIPATIFGGSVTIAGLGIAYWNYQRLAKRGRPMVYPTEIHAPIPGSVLAVLPDASEGREAVARAACAEADDRAIVFVYRGQSTRTQAPRLFETVDPYFEDEPAKQAFGEAESIAREKNVKRHYVYLSKAPDAIFQFWQILRPRDTIIVDEDSQIAHTLAPDLVRLSPGPGGQVTHLIKRWQSPSTVGM
ncbi:MAG TPA: APC family permease [Ktedonobacterales bacterium]|jgi:amino acid transporter